MFKSLPLIFSIITLLFSPALFAEEKTNKELKKIKAEQKEIRKMRADTLKDLYKEKPAAQDQVMNSEAVAVFSSLGMNLFLFSTARGGGIIRDTQTGDETFMRMFSLGGGFGMGVKDFRVVFIFHTKQAVNDFVNAGWDFSASADAAAKAGEDGESGQGAATVVPGVTLYQLTKNGLALQATLQGTKYYKDDDLNNN